MNTILNVFLLQSMSYWVDVKARQVAHSDSGNKLIYKISIFKQFFKEFHLFNFVLHLNSLYVDFSSASSQG